MTDLEARLRDLLVANGWEERERNQFSRADQRVDIVPDMQVARFLTRGFIVEVSMPGAIAWVMQRNDAMGAESAD